MGIPGISTRRTRIPSIRNPSSFPCRRAARRSDSGGAVGRGRVFGWVRGRQQLRRWQRHDGLLEVGSYAAVAVVALKGPATPAGPVVIIIDNFKPAGVIGRHDFLDGVAVRGAPVGEAKLDGGAVPRL